jgi:hypothetical protein
VPLTHDEPHLGGLRTWFLCRNARSTLSAHLFSRIFVPAPFRFGLGEQAFASVAAAIHRVMTPRRRVGLGPPFSPIPKRQARYKRYQRLVARILIEESVLVDVRVNHDLDRRTRLRGMLMGEQRATAKR